MGSPLDDSAAICLPMSRNETSLLIAEASIDLRHRHHRRLTHGLVSSSRRARADLGHQAPPPQSHEPRQVFEHPHPDGAHRGSSARSTAPVRSTISAWTLPWTSVFGTRLTAHAATQRAFSAAPGRRQMLAQAGLDRRRHQPTENERQPPLVSPGHRVRSLITHRYRAFGVELVALDRFIKPDPFARPRGSSPADRAPSSGPSSPHGPAPPGRVGVLASGSMLASQPDQVPSGGNRPAPHGSSASAPRSRRPRPTRPAHAVADRSDRHDQAHGDDRHTLAHFMTL